MIAIIVGIFNVVLGLILLASAYVGLCVFWIVIQVFEGLRPEYNGALKKKADDEPVEDEAAWTEEAFDYGQGFGNPSSDNNLAGPMACSRCGELVEDWQIVCQACCQNLFQPGAYHTVDHEAVFEALRDAVTDQVQAATAEVEQRQAAESVSPEESDPEPVDILEPSISDRDESVRFSSPLVESVRAQDAQYLTELRERLERANKRGARKTEKTEGENKS